MAANFTSRHGFGWRLIGWSVGGSATAAFEDNLAYHAFGSRTLRLATPNLRGTDVKVLQTIYNQMLKIMNPPQGPMGKAIAVDGVFGPQTDGAVRDVQSYFGIAVDGVVGQNTYGVFGQGIGALVTYGGPRFGSRTLNVGRSGGDVVVLQNRLNFFHYAQAIGRPADGKFGAQTKSAVVQFQTDASQEGDSGLPTSGVVGPATFDALWVLAYAGGRNLREGDFGFDVAFTQYYLSQTSNPANLKPFYTGHVDGYFGGVTRSAVVTFQQVSGIGADGIVGPVTYHQIGVHNANPAPAPAPVPPF